jgi:hypothetical protein
VAGQGANANQGSNGNVALNPASEMQGLQRGTDAVKKKRGDRENQRSHDFLINHCSDWGSALVCADLTGLVVSGR